MTPIQLQTLAITPALSLLPARMDSREARVMLIAMALQESRIQHRVQIGGPARGYWQFERGGGVAGVLQHHASRDYIVRVCLALDYPARVRPCYDAIRHNDVLAASFARLLLWTLPQALPINESDGWDQYLEAWRPGKPHPDTWPANWRTAQETIA